MDWLDDYHWGDTIVALARLSPRHRVLLTPPDWAGLDNRYMPMDYGACLAPGECTGFAIAKVDVDRLPLHLLNGLGAMRCVFANPVFVVFSSLAEDGAQISRNEIARQLDYFMDRREAVLAGEFFRQVSINPKFPEVQPGPRTVLVISASHMGNFGDELLAAGTCALVHDANPALQCLVVRPDYVPPVGATYAAIVIGGGGLVYDTEFSHRGNRNQLANVTNYFRFGFIARALNIPFVVLGVGGQHHFKSFASIQARDFVVRALAGAALVATRDEPTAESLRECLAGFAVPLETYPDLAFRIARRPNHTPPCRAGAKSIAVVGEVWTYSKAMLRIVPLLRDAGVHFTFCLQANEDAGHVERFKLEAGVDDLDILDLRSMRIEDGIARMTRFDGIVTCRFHSLVLAVANGIPAIALDTPRGKRSKLLTQTFLRDDPRCSLLANDCLDEQAARAVHALLSHTVQPRAEDVFSFAGLTARLTAVLAPPMQSIMED